MSGPLQGLKVIEFAHIMAGPVCGLMLADMGAEVIKVEKIPAGDDTRRMLPPAIGDESAAYLMMNRNKRGIALDLKSQAGRDVAVSLIDNGDVVIENYRKGTMDRLGLGYPQMRERNPGIIYAELSGFGRTGPYADRAGFDLVAQGMSGLMSITGEGGGGPPIKCGAPVTDITAGILAAMGVLGALFSRTHTQRGQRVDSSLFEAGIMHTYWQSAITMATGVAPGAMGSAHPLNAPYQAFQTRDGWITVGAANQANWLKLLDVIEATWMAQDKRFETNIQRMQHLPELVKVLNGTFIQYDSSHWLKRLEQAGVPAGPVLDIAQMHADPQALARGIVTQAPHSILGEVATLGHPVQYSETPSSIRRGAPVYGEHTREVLAEHGYSKQQIESFLHDGVVIAA